MAHIKKDLNMILNYLWPRPIGRSGRPSTAFSRDRLIVSSLKSLWRNCHINKVHNFESQPLNSPPVAGGLRPFILGLSG